MDEPDRRKSSHGQCCGMLCVNALAVEVAELINPPTLTSRWELAAYRRTADNDPAALYRPKAMVLVGASSLGLTAETPVHAECGTAATSSAR